MVGADPSMLCLWANGWNITQIIFLFIYTPFRNSPTGQTSWWIFMFDGSSNADSRRMCLLGIRPYCTPFKGSNSTKTPILGAWIGGFSHWRQILKLAYFRNYYTSIVTKFYTVIETSKYSLWVVQISSNQIQDGGRLNLNIFATD